MEGAAVERSESRGIHQSFSSERARLGILKRESRLTVWLRRIVNVLHGDWETSVKPVSKTREVSSNNDNAVANSGVHRL